MKLNNSSIQLNFNKKEDKKNIYRRSLSPYLFNSNTLMDGFLKRSEKMFLQSYYSAKEIDDIYNYAK